MKKVQLIALSAILSIFTCAPNVAATPEGESRPPVTSNKSYLKVEGFKFPTLEAYSFASGRIASGAHAGPFQFAVSSDSVTYTGSNYVDGIWVQHNFGGPGTRGSRDAIFASLTQIAPTDNVGNLTQYYVGGIIQSSVSFNESGKAGLSHLAGSNVGINVIANCGARATYFYTCNSMEVDTSTAPGEHVGHKFGILSVLSNGDGSRGDYDDAALGFVAGSKTSPGWGYIFQFGKSDSTGDFSSATSTATTLLGCSNASYKCRIGTGLDLRTNWEWQATREVLASPGFDLDSRGNVDAATYSVNHKVGATCAAGTINIKTLAVTNGLVTHC